MRMKKRKYSSIINSGWRSLLRMLFSSCLFFFEVNAFSQLVDKTPAAIPNVPSVYHTEPYEDPLVSGINREPSRATAYSYQNINDALNGDREKSGRFLSLNGEWDFSFALKPSDAPG